MCSESSLVGVLPTKLGHVSPLQNHGRESIHVAPIELASCCSAVAVERHPSVTVATQLAGVLGCVPKQSPTFGPAGGAATNTTRPVLRMKPSTTCRKDSTHAGGCWSWP